MRKRRGLFFIIQIVLATLFLSLSFSCQKKIEEKKSIEDLLIKQPKLKFDEKVPQRYKITSTLYNRDMEGNIVSTIQLSGKFTRYVEKGEVLCRWEDVKMVSSKETSSEFPEGKSLDYLEDFLYPLSGKILNEDFYKDFPEEEKTYVKTLIWDAPWIEVAYVSIDNAEYNKPFFSSDLENKKIDIQNFALLKIKNLKGSWSGVAKKNGEVCALIEFKALSNPIETKLEGLSVKGRTCSWGSFWVSLEDHEVEYAQVNEDVIMEMTLPNFPKQILNMQREVEFQKIR
ncbi:MAG: hypothetical protein ABIN61_02145 [candidate division WOR-3 bacterium]